MKASKILVSVMIPTSLSSSNNGKKAYLIVAHDCCGFFKQGVGRDSNNILGHNLADFGFG